MTGEPSQTVADRQPDAPEIFHCEGTPAKLRRRLTGDLDVITLKALRKEPQRRYASVEQMAEDIRHHLEGLPVLAVPDSLRYRTGKFLQRHTLGVVATLVMLIAISGGVAATIREARIAAANERRAEERFNDVRKLAGSLMFEIHDSIAGLPGATPVRRLIVQRSLEYLDSLSREASGDLSLQRELANAYMKLGSVQGVATGSNLGDFKGALESFRKALAIRESIAASSQNRVEDRIALAEAERLTALVLWMDLDSTAEGLQHIQRAVAITEQAALAAPDDGKILTELADCYRYLADLLEGDGIRAGMGNLEEGIKIHRKALEIRKRLAEADPSDEVRQQRLGSAIFGVGDDLAKQGKRVEAFQYYLKARDTFAALAQGENGKVFRSSMSVCYSRMGDMLMFDGKAAEALAAFQQDVALVEPLAKADPTDVHHQLKLVGATASAGHAMIQAGRAAEGRKLISRGLAIVNAQPGADHDSQIRGYRAFITAWLGEEAQARGDIGSALRQFQEALELYRSLASADAQDMEDRASESEMHSHLGAAFLQAGETKKALAELQLAYSMADSLLSHRRDNVALLYASAYASAGLGKVYAGLAQRAEDSDVQIRRWSSAADWYQKSLASLKKIPNPSRFAPSFCEVADPTQVLNEARIAADHLLAPKRKKGADTTSIAARQRT